MPARRKGTSPKMDFIVTMGSGRRRRDRKARVEEVSMLGDRKGRKDDRNSNHQSASIPCYVIFRTDPTPTLSLTETTTSGGGQRQCGVKMRYRAVGDEEVKLTKGKSQQAHQQSSRTIVPDERRNIAIRFRGGWGSTTAGCWMGPLLSRSNRAAGVVGWRRALLLKGLG